MHSHSHSDGTEKYLAMRIRATWILRLWLTAELATIFLAARHPNSDSAASLFAAASIVGVGLAGMWLAHHGRGLPKRWSAQLRADRLAGLSMLAWVFAVIAFALSSQLGLEDVAKGLAIAAFVLSSAWVIKHRPRWVAAGLLVLATTNWLASRSQRH
jgi:hypothetical protein